MQYSGAAVEANAMQEPLVRTITGMLPEALAARPPRNMTGDPNETVGSNLATFVFHECYHVGQTGCSGGWRASRE